MRTGLVLLLLAIVVIFTGCGSAPPPAAVVNVPAPSASVVVAADSPPPPVQVVEPRTGFDCSLPDGGSLYGPRDPSIGSDSAPVVIVEFSDFQCPFCARVVDTLHDVLEGYGPSKVRLVFKHMPLPFHQNARPAAQAAEAVFQLAGNAAFWRFHDRAFGDQQNLTSDMFRVWARESGVTDLSAFDGASMGPGVGDKIDQDGALAKSIGANGTPHFFINGVELSGAQPADSFRKAIDAELAKALASADQGPAAWCAIAKKNVAAKAAVAAAPVPEDKGPWVVPVGNSPSIGSASAAVTVIEFGDFQCPFCKRVDPVLAELVKTYGKDLRVVWKNEPLPFHPRAEPAAELAMEAFAERGSAAFWDAHDRIYASAPKLDDNDLAAIAGEMKLNVAAVRSAITNHKFKKAIDDDAALAEDVKASGTPHFFVNGRRIVGAQPVEAFKALIDEELIKGREAAKSGNPYDVLQKTARKAAPLEKKVVGAAPKTAPSRGSAGAPVVIQEFSDFQCPFCERVNATLKQVETTYGTRVRIVWRNRPLSFHNDAQLAAEAAMEARAQKGDAAFWKMHDLLFASQKVEDGLTRPALERIAGEVGLDMDKFRAALDGHTQKAVVDADGKAADDASISGTPAFVINGYFVSGAQPLAAFKKVIDRALADAAGGKKH